MRRRDSYICSNNSAGVTLEPTSIQLSELAGAYVVVAVLHFVVTVNAYQITK
jgi:hypothetical protein